MPEPQDTPSGEKDKRPILRIHQRHDQYFEKKKLSEHSPMGGSAKISRSS